MKWELQGMESFIVVPDQNIWTITYRTLQYIRWNSCFVSFPEYLSMESTYITEHMVHLLSSLGIYFPHTHWAGSPPELPSFHLRSPSFLHLLSFWHRLELIIHRNKNNPSFIFFCQNFYTLKQILKFFFLCSVIISLIIMLKFLHYEKYILNSIFLRLHIEHVLSAFAGLKIIIIVT